MIEPTMTKNNLGYLAVKGRSQTEELIGTSFAIADPLSEDGMYYLVTCRHVVQDPLSKGKQIYLRLNKLDKPGSELTPLKGAWFSHPADRGVDPAGKHAGMVDLAIFQLPKRPDTPVSFAYLNLEDSLAAQRSAGGAREGEKIVSAGLFNGMPGMARNTAVRRSGHIALAGGEALPGVKSWLGAGEYYLSDLRGDGQMAGSPVYGLRQIGKESIWALLGVAAGPYPAVRHKNESDRQDDFSLIVPFEKLVDLIHGEEMAEARAERRRRKSRAK